MGGGLAHRPFGRQYWAVPMTMPAAVRLTWSSRGRCQSVSPYVRAEDVRRLESRCTTPGVRAPSAIATRTRIGMSIRSMRVPPRR